MEPPGPHATVDRLTTEAERNELRMSDDSVLPPCQRRNRGIDRLRLQLCSHSESKCRLAKISPLSRVVHARMRASQAPGRSARRWSPATERATPESRDGARDAGVPR